MQGTFGDFEKSQAYNIFTYLQNLLEKIWKKTPAIPCKTRAKSQEDSITAAKSRFAKRVTENQPCLHSAYICGMVHSVQKQYRENNFEHTWLYKVNKLLG